MTKALKAAQTKGIKYIAPVAQLDRVPDYESVGRRFESCQARQI